MYRGNMMALLALNRTTRLCRILPTHLREMKSIKVQTQQIQRRSLRIYDICKFFGIEEYFYLKLSGMHSSDLSYSSGPETLRMTVKKSSGDNKEYSIKSYEIDLCGRRLEPKTVMDRLNPLAPRRIEKDSYQKIRSENIIAHRFISGLVIQKLPHDVHWKIILSNGLSFDKDDIKKASPAPWANWVEFEMRQVFHDGTYNPDNDRNYFSFYRAHGKEILRLLESIQDKDLVHIDVKKLKNDQESYVYSFK